MEKIQYLLPFLVKQQKLAENWLPITCMVTVYHLYVVSKLALVIWQSCSGPSNLNSGNADLRTFPLILQVGLDVPVFWI